MPTWLDGPGPILLAVTLFFVSLTIVSLALGFLLERAVPKRRIWKDPLPDGQYRHELIGNGIFLAVTIAACSAALHFELIRFGPESIGRAAGTFAAMTFGFHVFFYALHRALHLPSLVRFHRWHHVSRITTPLSGQSMSLGEALGWMGCYVLLPALLSYAVPLSFEGLVAYLAYNVIGNIVGHANVELVPPSRGLRTRSLFATVFTYHALHHLRWTGHYGFASTWADRLLGTEWPDWIPLHARVCSGTPLELAATKRVGEALSAPAGTSELPRGA